jgi:DNA repair exonuclease SbcCD ATPase subunit
MREFLKGLELDKETIDTIMAEHGKYLTGLKEQVEEYKTKINDYETQVKELNSKIDDDTKSLENLQNLTNENKDLRAEIQMSGSKVKSEFSKFVKNEVMSKVNDDVDFNTALEDYKKENPQYFGDTVVKRVQTSPSLNTGENAPHSTNEIMNDILRGALNN